MEYVSLIKNTLSCFEHFSYDVQLIKGIPFIRVYFFGCSLPEIVLSSLLEIDGLRLVSINFVNRYLLFSY